MNLRIRLALLFGIGSMTGCGYWLLISLTLSIFAGTMGLTLFGWWMVSHDKFADLAIIFSFRACSQFVATPVTTTMCDRHDKSTILNWSGIAILGAALFQAVLLTSGNYSLIIVAILAAINGIAMSAILPLRQNLILEFIEPKDATGAVAFQRMIDSVMRVAGPLAGSLAGSAFGLSMGLWLSVLMMSASWLSGVLVRSALARPSAGGTSGGSKWVDDMVHGVLVRFKLPIERYCLVLGFVQTFCFVPLTSIFLPKIVGELQLPMQWLGIFETSIAIGVIVGAFIANQAITRFDSRLPILVCSLCITGAMFVIQAFISAPALIAATFVIVSCFYSVAGLAAGPHRLLAIPRDYRNRITAASTLSFTLAASSGMACLSYFDSISSWRIVYALSGILLATTSLLYGLVPRLPELLRLEPQRANEWYRIEFPSMFVAKASSR